jgi:hypothetical protein
MRHFALANDHGAPAPSKKMMAVVLRLVASSGWSEFIIPVPEDQNISCQNLRRLT